VGVDLDSLGTSQKDAAYGQSLGFGSGCRKANVNNGRESVTHGAIKNIIFVMKEFKFLEYERLLDDILETTLKTRSNSCLFVMI
jgi:hypothetical protein